MAGLARRPARGALAALAAALLLAACASTPRGGTWHVVRPGETVWRISRHYGVSAEHVRRANEIRDVRAVAVGRRLWIPGARGPAPRRALVAPEAARRAAYVPSSACADALREADLRFTWPVRGKLTSRFGRRGRRQHDGIDVSARSGTPIRAAEAGRVIHSGRGLGAYGNVVIVKHAGRWATVYAHTRRNLVRKGQFVERGQTIAEVGATGNATGPHLHFEVRRGDVARDPLVCLPTRVRS